ncbi:hypothetical protein RSOLAG22IIIB_08490 [Rhizoctonia solani]|uniref:Laminin domain protein n=1 Tax=Rhizoctonia solani TaxID=456999 RepID=A0A0K6FTL9_9AGAM|nr:hypothetical protein RSOLAG22IIIB_08490 [Rhizoctonia solani]
MTCHRHKYTTSALPSDVVYDPPSLPAYIPVELKPVTGPPSNEEIASVHTALRVSENFANVPSIFDPDLHVQLSQHLFDIQLARHVQRSIIQRAMADISVSQNQTVRQRDSGGTDPSNIPETHTSPTATPGQVTGPTETQRPIPEQSNSLNEPTSYQNPNQRDVARRSTELMMEIRNRLDDVSRILVGTQNSLARGFNSSFLHGYSAGDGISHDLGVHSLINDRGELPEAYNLPTFKSLGNYQGVSFVIDNLTGNDLARYLRFYNIGEDMIEEGEELKIKSDMTDDARAALSRRLYLKRR